MAPWAESASAINELSLDKLTAFAFQFFVQTLTMPSLLSTGNTLVFCPNTHCAFLIVDRLTVRMAATPMTSPGIKPVLGDVAILSAGIWKAWTKAIHHWLLVNHCAYCVEIDVLTTKVVEAEDNSASSLVLTDEAEQVEQPATAFPSSSSHTSCSPVLDNAVVLIILEKGMSKEDWHI